MLKRLGQVLGNVGFLFGFPFVLFAIYVAIAQSNHDRWAGVIVLAFIGFIIWGGGRAFRYILGG